MKKILSILLAFVMVLCLMPSSVLPVSAEAMKLEGVSETRAILPSDDINADFVTGVTVNPSKQKVKKGTSFTFTAEVLGTVNTVNWSVEDNNSSGTYIDQNGRLTVASDEDAYCFYVKAESTFDHEIYGRATVYPTDEAVYISKVTVSPSSVSVMKGGSQDFEATVEGTDFTDVTWSISEHTSENTRMSYGELRVGSDETVSVIKVRATSVRDTSKYGEATVTVIDQQTISSAKVVYDTSKVGLTTSLTGRQVSEALNRAIDFSDVIEGTYVYSGGYYTCLCKDIVIDSENRATFTPLNYSDEYINTSDEYYYVFNIENKSGYLFDIDNIPSVTINGVPADIVCWRSRSQGGDLNVFKRVYIDGTSPYQAEFLEIEEKSVYEGYTSNPVTEVSVINTGSHPLNINSLCMTVSNSDDFYLYASSYPSVIQVGNTYTINLALKAGRGPGLYETDIFFRDLNGQSDQIKTHAAIRVIGEIREIYINNVKIPKAGEYADDYVFDFHTADETKYYVDTNEWYVKNGSSYQIFNKSSDIFELGKTYYLLIAVRNEDDNYRFAIDHYDPSILRVSDFYINYGKVTPVFDYYWDDFYWMPDGTWLSFMVPITVTKVAGADVEVTSCPSSAFTEGVDYTVDGQYVTVYGDTPCKVGYLSGGKYEACSIYSYSGNRHTFVVPDSVDEVMLVIKGDVDLSGEFDFFDAVVSKAMDLHPEDGYSIEELFAADVDDDGEFSFFDVILTKAADLGKTPFSWL